MNDEKTRDSENARDSEMALAVVGTTGRLRSKSSDGKSVINAKSEQLSAELEHLWNALQKLAEKIEPVLEEGLYSDTNASEKSDVSVTSNSRVANYLSDQIENVGRMISFVEGVTHRVEL